MNSIDSFMKNINKLYEKTKKELELLGGFEKNISEVLFIELRDFCKCLINNLIINKKTRFILLVYAAEIAKNPRSYVSFWKTFYEDLGIQYQRIYEKLFSMLWQALKDLGIEGKIRGNRRLCVVTIKDLVGADPEIRKIAELFFIESYKRYRNRPVSDVIRSSQNYKDLEKERKEYFQSIVEDLWVLINFIEEKCLPILDNEDALRARIVEGLGQRYDPKRVTRRDLQTLVRKVSNRFTPAQFKRTLREERQTSILCPDEWGRRGGLLLNKDLDYGTYIIGEIEYQITPDSRISLRDMGSWRLEQITELSDFDKVYYKKSQHFSVSCRSKEPVRRFFWEGKKYYVWCGSVAVGDEIIINTQRFRREGFRWDVKLRLQRGNQENPMGIKLEIPYLIFFNYSLGNRHLTILCDVHKKRFLIDSRGLLKEFDLEVELTGDETRIEIFVTVDDLGEEKTIVELDRKVIELDDHLLFSKRTRELIKGKERTLVRNYGERDYFLFTTALEDELRYQRAIEIGGQIVEHIEVLNQREEFGRYKIYEISWRSKQDFQLIVQDREWRFERKDFLEAWFIYGKNQFISFKERDVVIRIQTSSKLLEENDLYLRILDEQYIQIMDFSFTEDELSNLEKGKGQYEIPGKLIEEFLEESLEPGKYYLELEAAILMRLDFYILPELIVEWPTLLCEGESLAVTISTPQGKFLHGENKEYLSILKKEVRGRVREFQLNRIPMIEPEEISIKVGFTNPFIIQELKPKNPIYVFGYRLYSEESSKTGYTYEQKNFLNIYRLKKGQIFVFSKPNTEIRLNCSERTILKVKTNEDGIYWIKDLYIFSRYCKDNITEIKIQSQEFTKSFEIVWNTRIHNISLSNKYYKPGTVVSCTFDFEGPLNDVLKIILETLDDVVAERQLFCQGKRTKCKLDFKLPNVSKKYAYIRTFYRPLGKGAYLPLQSVKMTNIETANVEISTDGSVETLTVKEFLEKEVSFAYQALKSPFLEIKTECDLLIDEFLEILTELAPELVVLKPEDLVDENFLQNLFSIDIKAMTQKGLAVPSKGFLKTNRYVSKPGILFVISHQRLVKAIEALRNLQNKQIVLLRKI